MLYNAVYCMGRYIPANDGLFTSGVYLFKKRFLERKMGEEEYNFLSGITGGELIKKVQENRTLFQESKLTRDTYKEPLIDGPLFEMWDADEGARRRRDLMTK